MAGGMIQLKFGNNASGLTAATQVSQIRFVNPTGFAPGTYLAKILGTGEVVPLDRPSVSFHTSERTLFSIGRAVSVCKPRPTSPALMRMFQ